MSKPNDQCNRCGIDRDVHDLAPSIGHAFVEPARAEGEGELDPILHPAGHTPAVIACPCGWRRDAAAACNKMLVWRAENKMDEVKAQAAKIENQNQYPFADKVHRCVSIVHIHGTDKRGEPRT